MMTPSPAGVEEAVVLFGGNAGHGLEPVGKVGHPVVQRPGLHHIGNDIGHIGGQRLPAGNDLPQAAVGIVGQALLLHRVIKDQAAEQLPEYCSSKFTPSRRKAHAFPKKYVTNFITLHR